MYMYMYIYVHIYIHICIRVYAYRYVYTDAVQNQCSTLHLYVYVYVYVYVHIYIHICIGIYVSHHVYINEGGVYIQVSGKNFSKVGSMVLLYLKSSSELIFENFYLT